MACFYLPGRYPIHFHLSGNVSGSYVRGCSIHHTFNRAVTIHGVTGLLVEHNVAYHVMGHAFFIEDGIETGNTIQYNLGVFVQTSSTLLITDVTPATFWVTNPNNTGKFKRILEKMFLPVNLLNLRFSCFQFVTMPRLVEATMAFGTTCPTSLGDLHSPPQSVQRDHLWGSSGITLLIRSEGNFCYILFIRLDGRHAHIHFK